MSAKYWQRGETIDYTATGDLANGDVVNLATRIGVAGNDIPAGETGAVHVVGVFEIPKATGAVTVGQALYWDAARGGVHTDGTYRTRRLLYVDKADYGGRPMSGKILNLDGREYRVVQADEAAGVLTIEIEAIRT